MMSSAYGIFCVLFRIFTVCTVVRCLERLHFLTMNRSIYGIPYKYVTKLRINLYGDEMNVSLSHSFANSDILLELRLDGRMITV